MKKEIGKEILGVIYFIAGLGAGLTSYLLSDHAAAKTFSGASIALLICGITSIIVNIEEDE